MEEDRTGASLLSLPLDIDPALRISDADWSALESDEVLLGGKWLSLLRVRELER
jgi:hypothetical protein